MDVYTITNYTDDELYQILGLDPQSVTPEILENAIIDELRKYQGLRGATATKMYSMLKDMYVHFFQYDNANITEEEQDEYIENKVDSVFDIPNITNYSSTDDSTIDPAILDPETNVQQTEEELYSYSDYVEQYDVSNYLQRIPNQDNYELSSEGMALLGFSAQPTQNELEAKLIQNMEQVSAKDTPIKRQAFEFYKRLYQELFEIYEQPNNVEVLESVPEEEEEEENKQSDQDQDQAQNQTKIMEYTKGTLNPILKETIKRIISVDSQYREDVYPQSTDFTLNFTEVLKDVVSLKLYAVQIPITWYTISKNYGSNFFYIKPVNTAYNASIYNNTTHEYKVEIKPGNYTPASLTTEIQSGMSNLSTIYTDVSFGSTQFLYNQSNALGKIQLDIQKVYNEAYYTLDISGSSLQQLLGVTTNPLNQSLRTAYSNTYTELFETIKTDTYTVDNNNNTIIIRQYLASSSETFASSYNENTMTTIEDISITITNGEARTVEEIFNEINQALQTNTKLFGSMLEYVDSTTIVDGVTTNTMQMKWTVQLNRFNVQNIPNSKLVILFPSLINDINYITQVGEGVEDIKSLWIGTGTVPSGFNMGSSSKQFVQIPNLRYTPIPTIEGTENSRFIEENSMIIFRPAYDSLGGVYVAPENVENGEDNSIQIVLSTDSSTTYTTSTIVDLIQSEMQKEEYSLLQNSQITFENGVVEIVPNINKIYTSIDYRVVFYDVDSFKRCTNASNSFRNASADTTLGYILGFKDLTEYDLHPDNATLDDVDGVYKYMNPDTLQKTQSEYDHDQSQLYRDVVTLQGGSVVNIYLYNYFMLILDDFNQNHLNDGLVTVAPEDTSVTLPHYATRKNYRGCTDPETSAQTTNVTTTEGLTQKQVYSVEQIVESQNKIRSRMSSGPYVKDMFALLPVKANTTPGTTYVEFGGTLQQQERIYFGPVNIRRISIKLVNDKGDVVDLNGNNWSFQLVCEQLYKK